MQKLRFHKDGTFKIMQMTDIHYEDGSSEDLQTVALMRKLIRLEQPDFIMLSGDTVFNENNIANLSKAVEPITESGIPWSYIFGNHDTEKGAGYEKLYEEVLKQKGCMAYHDPDSGKGLGNHTIKIMGNDGQMKWTVFGLDSGNYNCLEHMEGYAYLDRTQVEWYQRKIKELEKENADFGALTFLHIPLKEFLEVWDYEVCYGEKNEGICCSRLNTGMFAAMQEVGHTRGVFAGHDHVNEYYGKLYGITLGYGRATGYNTYGREGFQRGARLFMMNENKPDSFDTYVRLEDGSVIDQPKKHEPERRREIDGE
ncbi:MAG: metallophosphoesterase [Clostridia bacterium]|nr:metallophosphoesterase [Clostridia bacterium]NCC44108.1 metallophosphoesterase [Clostridia bacterium]